MGSVRYGFVSSEDVRRYQKNDFVAFSRMSAILEKWTEDWNVAEPWNLRDGIGIDVAQQAS